jgi:hypothetical protein
MLNAEVETSGQKARPIVREELKRRDWNTHNATLARVRLVCYAPHMAERNEMTAAIQHPLAVTRTELVWEGKYDSAGNRVVPLRVALPFQMVETANESAADRRHSLKLFGQHRQTEWRNRLIWATRNMCCSRAGIRNQNHMSEPRIIAEHH